MIRERAPGVWEVVVYAGRDPVTGRERRVSRSVRGTERDARRRESKLILELDESGVKATEATVGAVVAAWLDHAAPSLSPSTLAGYRRYIRFHIEPRLGDLPVTKLTTKRLDDFYAVLQQKGAGRFKERTLSAATIRQTHAILRRALGQAVKWGWLPNNPADLASPPSLRRRELAPPATDVVGRLIEAARFGDPGFATLLWVAAVTGARRGELCGLRWMDVDWSGALVIQRAVVTNPDGTLHLKDTKTHQARRLALDAATIKILGDHRTFARGRALQFGAQLSDRSFIFTDDDPTGQESMNPDMLSYRFRHLCKQQKVRVRFHDLRHYAATQALDAGIPVPTVSGRLGHANPATTLSVYAHFVQASDQAAANVLGASLTGNAKRTRGKIRSRGVLGQPASP